MQLGIPVQNPCGICKSKPRTKPLATSKSSIDPVKRRKNVRDEPQVFGRRSTNQTPTQPSQKNDITSPSHQSHGPTSSCYQHCQYHVSIQAKKRHLDSKPLRRRSTEDATPSGAFESKTLSLSRCDTPSTRHLQDKVSLLLRLSLLVQLLLLLPFLLELLHGALRQRLALRISGWDPVSIER